MLRVVKPGFYSTLQDSGRYMFRDKGVPFSGCMDAIAYEQCNHLLENDKNAVVLEMTMTGPELEFGAPTYIALTGANMNPKLNGEPIENHLVVKVNTGDILKFNKVKSGFRCYLGVKNGFKVNRVLSSGSQFTPLTEASHISKNEEIEYEEVMEFSPKITGMKPDNYLGEETIQVFQGPEFKFLSENQIEMLLESDFHIANENNRMAYQLEETFQEHSHSILTSATLPGTVQWTPAGRLIILMRDGQTTGGYPRLFQLRRDAISTLAQKKTGDKIKFELFYT